MYREFENTPFVVRDIITVIEAHNILVDWFDCCDKIIVIGHDENMNVFNKYYEMFASERRAC